MKMGSAMWQLKIRLRRNPWRFILPVVVVIAILMSATLLFDEEVEYTGTRTVGQAVIDGWVYGGLDSSGNLIFQQGDQVVLLPKGSSEIKLNGKRAEIIRSSADTIQIADQQVDEGSGSGSGWFSAPFWLVCGVVIGWWLGKQKPSRPVYRGRNLKGWTRTRFVR